MPPTSPTDLRRLLQAPPLLAPGVHDALSAAMAEQAGFKAVYLSGAAVAYTRLGGPDIGLVGMTEMADVLARIRERVALPIVIDGDTGFGNAIGVQRTVRAFERAGASAIQIEDQAFPKRCGHLRQKSLIPAAEMAGKIRAALDAHDQTLIIARTDAIGVEGFPAALDRAALYREAGADLIFVEGPESDAQLSAIVERFAGQVPLMANMVEGGTTPIHTVSELGAMGFALVIFPGGLMRALAWAAQRYFASLAEHGTTDPFRDRMFNFTELNQLLGTDAILAKGRLYDGV
jgi:2-methylisocitrate lyase-like PEP mutase family enzyme